MCCCASPNINGQPGYSWDGQNIGTRPIAPPALLEGDVLLYDEPGRCGGMDSHCHHYRLVKHMGSTVLLVRHGGGDERQRLSLPDSKRGFDVFAAMDSNTRYWVLNAMHHAAKNAERAAQNTEAGKWRKAFVDGRLKKRKLPARGIKVWIEPEAPTVAALDEVVRMAVSSTAEVSV
jgi:hypothetical protein